MSNLESVPQWLRMALGTAMPEAFELEQRAFDQLQKPKGLSRRAFLGSITVAAAGLAVDPKQLIWTPTQRKKIILPVAIEEGIELASSIGARYYMHFIDEMEVHHHLFFDSGWRLLHAVKRNRRGAWVLNPLTNNRATYALFKQTGYMPVELGQMACQKHHGIYDTDPTTTYDGNTWAPTRKRVPTFTVREVAERGPTRVPGIMNVHGIGPVELTQPQQFRDLTPEETVRLVHDAHDRTTGVPRGNRRRSSRVPGGYQLGRV